MSLTKTVMINGVKIEIKSYGYDEKPERSRVDKAIGDIRAYVNKMGNRFGGYQEFLDDIGIGKKGKS